MHEPGCVSLEIPGAPVVALAPALVSEIRQLGPTANSLGDVGIQHWLSPYCLLFFEDFLDLTEVLSDLLSQHCWAQRLLGNKRHLAQNICK